MTGIARKALGAAGVVARVLVSRGVRTGPEDSGPDSNKDDTHCETVRIAQESERRLNMNILEGMQAHMIPTVISTVDHTEMPQ